MYSADVWDWVDYDIVLKGGKTIQSTVTHGTLLEAIDDAIETVLGSEYVDSVEMIKFYEDDDYVM